MILGKEEEETKDMQGKQMICFKFCKGEFNCQQYSNFRFKGIEIQAVSDRGI
jgi:hypothetical protein